MKLPITTKQIQSDGCALKSTQISVEVTCSLSQACIFLSFPPPGGGGKKIKGSGDGEGNLRGEKEKKRKFGENITFYSTKS